MNNQDVPVTLITALLMKARNARPASAHVVCESECGDVLVSFPVQLSGALAAADLFESDLIAVSKDLI